ncbi:MAG: hypothetical protein WBF90_33820 [Rivularia sp. (in: cyanobacteria)]
MNTLNYGWLHCLSEVSEQKLSDGSVEPCFNSWQTASLILAVATRRLNDGDAEVCKRKLIQLNIVNSSKIKSALIKAKHNDAYYLELLNKLKEGLCKEVQDNTTGYITME